MERIKQDDYRRFVRDIKERIRKSQYNALKAVNKQLINLYWDIGKIITEKQKKYNWGRAVVENLAKNCRKSFPEYPDSQKIIYGACGNSTCIIPGIKNLHRWCKK